MYKNCCKKCGSIKLYTKQKGSQIGLYCGDCGAWIKWLGKDELRAFEYSMREPTKEEQENVNKYIKNISKPTGLKFNEDKTIIDRLQNFIDCIDKEIDYEMNNIPINSDDEIRKSAYCYGLQKVIWSLENIIEGKDFDYKE